MSGTPLRLGFLASHTGSSMRAIVEAASKGLLDAEAALVVSNNSESRALEFARARGLPALHISATTAGSPDAADAAIAEAMERAGVELIVLSGYLKKLGPALLRRFEGRILNIHPAYLPRHGGPGMYGRRVHEAAIASGDAHSGATVHVVDHEYDSGPILRRRPVRIRSGETVDTLQARVMAVEPGLYIQTLRDIIKRDKCVLPRRRRRPLKHTA